MMVYSDCNSFNFFFLQQVYGIRLFRYICSSKFSFGKLVRKFSTMNSLNWKMDRFFRSVSHSQIFSWDEIICEKSVDFFFCHTVRSFNFYWALNFENYQYSKPGLKYLDVLSWENCAYSCCPTPWYKISTHH